MDASVILAVMGHLKQQSSGIPAMVMGVVFVLIGLGGVAWLLASLDRPVYGAKDGSGFVLMVAFAVVLIPACIVIGLLAFWGGYRKSNPKAPWR